MRRSTAVPAVALGAVLSLAVAACGGGSNGDSTSSSNGEAKAAFNAGIGKVFNPSTTKGGTLRMAVSDPWDSVDPGDGYYAMGWNMARLYGRALTMFKSAPGAEGSKLVPDLAESLGESSNGGKTWTYTLKSGLKFEDGTPITSKDVKYAVSRSLDKSVLPNGYTYFNDYLVGAADFSVYKGAGKGTEGLPSIETPDERTIVFNLTQAFGGFDYFAMLPATIPVPKAKDTGAKYKQHVVASGPYKFSEYDQNKGFTLVRNTNWDAATDPNRAALPDTVTVQWKQNADDIDNRLISGDLDVDIAGAGRSGPGAGRRQAQAERRQRGAAANLVHLDQPGRRPAGQRGLPQGGRVRGRQDLVPERVRGASGR
jgi:peptide/nickel transport system substrate-binding protein